MFFNSLRSDYLIVNNRLLLIQHCMRRGQTRNLHKKRRTAQSLHGCSAVREGWQWRHPPSVRQRHRLSHQRRARTSPNRSSVKQVNRNTCLTTALRHGISIIRFSSSTVRYSRLCSRPFTRSSLSKRLYGFTFINALYLFFSNICFKMNLIPIQSGR